MEIPYYLIDDTSFVHDEYNVAGSRYSSKTYSVGEMIAFIFAMVIKYQKKVAIYAFRKLNKDTSELTKEIYNSLTAINITESNYFKLKFPNKQADFRFKNTSSFIRVMGVYSNSNDRIPLKGLSRSEVKDFDIVIVWKEEANELTNSEMQAIRFALGNAKKLIEINTCNPDSIQQDYISYINSIFPFDLEIMKHKNEMIKSTFHNNKFKLFHYSNWKVNKHNLTNDIINNLEELKLLDPIKAQSWYWGVPSVLEGTIFARYLDDLKTNIDFKVTKIIGGLDIGTATSSSGHPTAASLWFIGENDKTRRAHKASEYYHSNATMSFKDTYQLANSIIDYYLKEAQRYTSMYFGFMCFVDYGNGGLAFIDILNREKQKRNISWLNFTPVDKSTMYLNDRIDFTTVCMVKNILSYNWEKCPETKRQYSLIKWLKPNKLETANNEPKMHDLHDDTWDSDCYALMNDMRWLVENINNSLLVNKESIDYSKQINFIKNQDR